MSIALRAEADASTALVPLPERLNSSFSLRLPTLQLVVDSSSLGEFKICPRRYYYRIILGRVPRTKNVHLTFGTLMHESREIYEHTKARGAHHEEALVVTIRYAMARTWDKKLGRPWDSGHKDKNRKTLILALVRYLDQFGVDDSLATMFFPDGKTPMVEVKFKFDTDIYTMTGEYIVFAGQIDRIALSDNGPYICDVKTTTHRLDDEYFAQYTPDNQISFYSWVGARHYDVTMKGVIIDGVQVKANYIDCQRRQIDRSQAQLDEWYHETQDWLNLMGRAAEANNWPMNDKSCNMYGGCPYRDVCKRAPGVRETWLELDYVVEHWDPAKMRE